MTSQQALPRDLIQLEQDTGRFNWVKEKDLVLAQWEANQIEILLAVII